MALSNVANRSRPTQRTRLRPQFQARLGRPRTDFRALKLRLTSARRRKSLARTQLEPPRPWVGSRLFFLALRAGERSPSAPSSWAASPPSAAWPIRRSGTLAEDARSLQALPGLEQLTAAPSGSSFSEEAHTDQSALLLVRAMVATAASDEVVDPSQRVKIVGELKDAGLDAQAAEFLDAEIQHPATIDAIANGVGSSKELLALQVYAAAHLVASSEPEKRFLKNIAAALTLDPSLIAHFNQTALLHTASAH